MKNAIYLSALTFILGACQNTSNSPAQEGDTEDSKSKAAQPHLDLVWETEAELRTNESVLFDQSSNTLWVSCIDGKPTEKDEKGYIAKVDQEGNIVDPAWASGFNAPKGSCITQGRFFFSDIDRIVSLNLENPNDKYVVEVPGSQFLNDLSPGLNGVYFSDMATGTLYYLENQIVHTINPALPNLNGLAFHNQNLYALSDHGLQKLSVGGEVLETINADLKGGDGLVVLDDRRFIVSRWQGEIWYVKNGQATKLLDSKDQELQTADIGFDPNTSMLYVPRFFANKVSAYRLKGI